MGLGTVSWERRRDKGKEDARRERTSEERASKRDSRSFRRLSTCEKGNASQRQRCSYNEPCTNEDKPTTTHELGQLKRTGHFRLCDLFFLILMHVQSFCTDHAEPDRCLRCERRRCGSRSRGGGEVWGRGGERRGGYERLLKGHWAL